MTATQYDLSIGDLMTIDPVMIALEAPIEDAERLILDHGVSGLPVVDRTGALVGVVSQTTSCTSATPTFKASSTTRPAASASAR